MLKKLQEQYPSLTFKAGSRFMWSPKVTTVFFAEDTLETNAGQLALLHELGHAILGHQTYTYDIELLEMEVTAWVEARKLAASLGVEIDETRIEDCLETYRIWLDKRSRCPECEATCLQATASRYRCFLCQTEWRVASTRTLQPRRMDIQTQN